MEINNHRRFQGLKSEPQLNYCHSLPLTSVALSMRTLVKIREYGKSLSLRNSGEKLLDTMLQEAMHAERKHATRVGQTLFSDNE